MKKKFSYGENRYSCLKKLLTIMQLSIFFLLISFISVSANTYSQVAKLDLNVQNAPISQVFDEIEQQSEFYFFYNKGEFDDTKKVSVECKNQNIENILSGVLKNTGMTFELNDRSIYIVKEEVLTKPSTGLLQQTTITGQITSCEDESTLPGVSVFIKGTTTGTITDIDGNYTIEASSTDVLVFSYIGTSNQEILVGNQAAINVALCQDLIGLDEVVVVGYGVQRKSDLTGAVASVKAEEMSKVASTNPAEALQGRIAGVTVTKVGGAPGGDIDIKIRGAGTFGTNNPLVVIDGIPGDLSLLNPDDIERMEVLKDGAAAAIYGAEAANGVILVTTKKGKIGETKVSLGAYASVNNPINSYDLLDAQGYQKVHRAMYEAAGETVPEYATAGFKIPNNTNWVDEVTQPGLTQNYNVRISGGNELATYAISGQFMDDKGVMIGSGFKKNMIKARTGIKKDRLSVDASISYIEAKTEPHKFSLNQAYHISPFTPVYDSNQEYGYGLSDLSIGLPHHTNPVADDHYLSEESTTRYTISNFDFGYELTDWLRWQTRVGYENRDTYDFEFFPPYQSNPKETHQYSKLEEDRTNWNQLLVENLLHFNKDFGEHHLSAVAGVTALKRTQSNTQAEVEGKTTNRSVVDGSIVEEDVNGGFLDPSFQTLDGGVGGTYNASGTTWIYTRSSILGRVNYNYLNRYYFQATVRRDGSSKFGKNYRYGTFPSFAIGWRLSEEDFLDYSWLDNLKLRASYGVLGNEITLENYEYQALMNTSNYYYGGYVRGDGRNAWPGTIARDLENGNLRWEETASTNIGVDFTINQTFTGTLNYYRNVTSDLLITKVVPLSAGVEDPTVNVGEVQNQGFEMELTYMKTKGDFKYNISGAFSTLHNEITQLSNPNQALFGYGLKYGTEHYPTQSKVGKPIGAFYLYKTAGIFQSDAEAENYVNADGDRLQPLAKAGDIKFVDETGDGTIDDEDKVYSGSGIPSFEYSVNFSASYKNFDLTAFFQGVAGNEIYNGNRFELEGMSSGQNFLSSTLNYWTPTNTNTDIPRAVLGDPNRNNRESDRFVESGAYLRLKTLQLGYNIPKSVLGKIKIDKLRLYVTGQNLFTITGYSGIDPEIGRTTVLNTGVDVSIYPITRSFIFGAQLTF